MPPTAFADALRWGDAVLALLLASTCAAAAVLASSWDQRGRFVVLAGYAVVTIGGHLATLGDPLNWRVPVLFVTTVGAVVSTTAYLVKARRRAIAQERGPGDRDGADQCPVLRAGAAARRRGRARHRTRTPGRSAAS